MNKTIVVQAYFVTHEIEEPDSFINKVKNFFIKKVDQEKHLTNDKTIDIVRLNDDINKEIAELNNLCYEIISITPITSGGYKYKYIDSKRNHNCIWSYGFSYTSGIIIMAKKVK